MKAGDAWALAILGSRGVLPPVGSVLRKIRKAATNSRTANSPLAAPICSHWRLRSFT